MLRDFLKERSRACTDACGHCDKFVCASAPIACRHLRVCSLRHVIEVPPWNLRASTLRAGISITLAVLLVQKRLVVVLAKLVLGTILPTRRRLKLRFQKPVCLRWRVLQDLLPGSLTLSSSQSERAHLLHAQRVWNSLTSPTVSQCS